MAHEEREDDFDKGSTMFASELKQASGEKGYVYNGKSLRVTVALDLTTFIHSKGHGSCHSSYLSYQFHSHASDEANVVIEISRVISATELLIPAAVDRFGSRVAGFISDDPCCSDSTIAHQVTMNDAFYNHDLTVVYHGECYKQEFAVAIHKLDSFDKSSRALSEVTRPCFAFTGNGFLNGPIGEDKLLAGHECGKVSSL
ncbi:PREDICTED: uncharacterized protein LOC101294841 [Fragaria vesca subsp. vesca]|uniref:uncharacterized protein LOC101294841 n=1 Tax=Fragaria vesca subsp. vesca TaxID=101020 RepID=UPI0002C36274|nr:PREDICTED: uncharacterized protein LOC101294841 [Fragaria vesca subsp. vesca]